MEASEKHVLVNFTDLIWSQCCHRILGIIIILKQEKINFHWNKHLHSRKSSPQVDLTPQEICDWSRVRLSLIQR